MQSSNCDEPHEAGLDVVSKAEPSHALEAEKASTEDVPVPGAPEGHTHQPAKKRQKKSRKGKEVEGEEPVKRSRRRGRLEMMPDMNLDILFYILGLLHPMDLLNLARTTKSFRHLLMQKSSAFAWKTARSQIQSLPDCPPDMSEPQYANLLFYPHCHRCGKVVPTIHWRLRLRYCPACRKEYLVDSRRCGAPVYQLPLALPRERMKQGRYKVFFVEREASLAFQKEYRKLPTEEREEFLKNKRLQVAEIEKHAAECEEWHRGVTSMRKSELDEVRSARADAILARIDDLGYSDVIEFFGGRIEMIERKVFSIPKPLTDKEWARICPDLLERVDGYRQQITELMLYNPRRKVLVGLYNEYVRKPAPPGAAVDMLPHVADLATFPPFDDIIK
ncbi:hypothetical protein HYDPIDRAFT_160988, partial [Hydnomerulius pinastri MD-312]